jgi:hypothetical protein
VAVAAAVLSSVGTDDGLSAASTTWVFEIKAYGEGIVDGRRTARAAEDWRRAIVHELSLGLRWHDRLNIENPQVSDPDAPIDPD